MISTRTTDRRKGLFGFFRRSNIFLLLVIGWGFGYLLFFGNNSLLYHFLLQRRIQAAQEDIVRIESENAELAREIERIKNDPVHLEGILRRLGYIRPQEKVFRVENDPASPAPPPAKSLPPLLIQIAVVLPVLLGCAAILVILRLRSRPRKHSPGGFHA